MVAQATGRTYGVNQVFRFFEGIWVWATEPRSDFLPKSDPHPWNYHLIYLPCKACKAEGAGFEWCIRCSSLWITGFITHSHSVSKAFCLLLTLSLSLITRSLSQAICVFLALLSHTHAIKSYMSLTHSLSFITHSLSQAICLFLALLSHTHALYLKLFVSYSLSFF